MSTRSDGDQVPVIFIHGAWLSARSWENYVDYFGKRGFAVSAPEWPRKHGDVEEIREACRAAERSCSRAFLRWSFACFGVFLLRPVLFVVIPGPFCVQYKFLRL